jgi:opacity protein-like surface antigen
MNVRSLLAVALAALLAPLAASAQTRGARATSTAPASAFSLGGWIGPELGDADGFQLRADGELPFQQIAPRVGLSLVGSIGYTFAGYDTFGQDVSVDRLKIVPTARFTFPLNPKVSFFGDAGLGLHYTSVSVEGFGGDASDSDVGFLLRFGAGAFFPIQPNIKLGAQLVLDRMFGDDFYDDSSFSILGGAMFTL